MRLRALVLAPLLASGCTLITSLTIERDAGTSDATLPDASTPDAGACAPCTNPSLPYCDPASGSCVACLRNFDCDDRDFCTTDECRVDHTCAYGAGQLGFVQQVAAGTTHTCAIDCGGYVFCWGGNASGQVGDGTFMTRQAPGLVGLTAVYPAVGIAAGGAHSCAIGQGSLECWGSNEFGQLGDMTMTSRPSPVSVNLDPLLPDLPLAEVTAGYAHTCLRTQSGFVYCWGKNGNGELGDGILADRSFPNSTRTMVGVSQAISAGGRHTCAVVSSTFACWGMNDLHQFGIDGAPSDSPIAAVLPWPANAGISPSSIAIESGLNHTCARVDDAVACWGDNSYAQLGHAGSGITPVLLADPRMVAEVSAGGVQSCARRTDGSVACWGANDFGQLGQGDQAARTGAVDVIDLSDARAISSGGGHTCVIRATGALVCWGDNLSGAVGDSALRSVVTEPVEVRLRPL